MAGLPSPFSNNSPLASAPYYSRISSNLGSATPVNYFMVAFNPGYALQASELNEVQEYFFLNQTLTQRMNSNWTKNGYYIPYWEGTVPLNPTDILLDTDNSSFNGTIYTLSLTIPSGWFLWTDANNSTSTLNSRLSFWSYFKTSSSSHTITATVANPANSVYIGFDFTKQLITCCPADACASDQDAGLRDNSQGSAETNYNTCGASRYKVSLELGAATSIGSGNFAPMFKVDPDLTATYIDGQTLYTPPTIVT